jgi:hypothetical protein
VLAQDRLAAELHRPLAAQHHPPFHRLLADLQQILDVDPLRRKVPAVHVDHALDRLGKGFAPHLFGDVPAVFRGEHVVLQRFNAHGASFACGKGEKCDTAVCGGTRLLSVKTHWLAGILTPPPSGVPRA